MPHPLPVWQPFLERPLSDTKSGSDTMRSISRCLTGILGILSVLLLGITCSPPVDEFESLIVTQLDILDDRFSFE